jgi:hypothetical protein
MGRRAGWTESAAAGLRADSGSKRGLHSLRAGAWVGAGIGGALGAWVEAKADASPAGPAAMVIGMVAGGLVGALLDYALVPRTGAPGRARRRRPSTGGRWIVDPRDGRGRSG